MTACPILDETIWTDLRQICEIQSPDFLIKSVDLFDDRSRALERDLDEANATLDRAKLRRAAHTLAGSAAIIGAVQLHDRAAVLEQTPDLPWDVVTHLLKELHDTCRATREALWSEVAITGVAGPDRSAPA